MSAPKLELRGREISFRNRGFNLRKRKKSRRAVTENAPRSQPIRSTDVERDLGHGGKSIIARRESRKDVDSEMQCVRHAASSANAQRKNFVADRFVRAPRKGDAGNPPRDECVDSGLRRGRRRLRSALVAPTSLHHRQHHAKFRIGVAGREPFVFCFCLEHNEHFGHLERQRHRRRLVTSGNDYSQRGLHGSGGPSGGWNRPGNRDKHCRFIRKRNGKCNDYKRYFRFAFAKYSQCGAWRNPAVSSIHQKPRTAGPVRSLEPCSDCLSQRLRFGRWKRQLYRAANSPESRNR
jgi:hypothetical protein